MLFAIDQGKESDSRLNTFGRMSLETNLVVIFIGLIAKIERVLIEYKDLIAVQGYSSLAKDKDNQKEPTDD